MNNILDNYRIVEIKDESSMALYKIILLNNKHTIKEFQYEIDKIKEEHKKEIEEFGDDLDIILQNIDNKFDWIEIPYSDKNLYI